jgi:hypothetical protein
MNFFLENIEAATPEEILETFDSLLERAGLDKAIRTPGGREINGEEFEQWFLRELRARANRRFISAREHIWRVIETYLRQNGGVFSRLSSDQLLELERTLFDVGYAHTSTMIGISVPNDIRRRLLRYGWSDVEILDFPGLAYRFALIRDAIESRQSLTWPELVRLAQSQPLSEAERNAIQVARVNGLQLLRPVFDATGRLMLGQALNRERGVLQQQVISAIEHRQHPFMLARDMLKEEQANGLFRDFERIARTEIANDFSRGSFQADRESGKFQLNDLLYRVTRPQACKICLALYTNPDGTPRLYRARDLERGTTPEIDIGVRVERFYRARIEQAHPNCLCAPWMKYYGEPSDRMFSTFAARYRDARHEVRLEVSEAA